MAACVNYVSSTVGTWSNFLEWSTEGKSPTAPVSCDTDSAVVDGVTTATKVPTEHAQKVWSGTRKWEESSTETTDRLREMFGIEVSNCCNSDPMVILFSVC